MVSWADMATLMMCFFLLMVSFANFDEKKAEVSLGSIRMALTRPWPLSGTGSIPPIQPGVAPKKGTAKDNELEKAKDRAKALLLETDINHAISVELGPEGLTLVALSPVLFEPGKAEIRPSVYGVLGTVAQVLTEYQNDIRIEGHTSSATPEAGSPYPTNWELSGARASAILHYLMVKHTISPARLSYSAFGSEKPKVSNDSPFGRRMNDRIEIKLVTAEEGEDVSSYLKTRHEDIPDDTEIRSLGKEKIPQGSP
jgi:chemotaxis protein MotB